MSEQPPKLSGRLAVALVLLFLLVMGLSITFLVRPPKRPAPVTAPASR